MTKITKNNMILGTTGHRPPSIGGYKIPNPTYNKIYNRTRDKIQHIQPSKIITGMALGSDQLIADIAINFKVPFIAAVPCNGQELQWPKESRTKYYDLLDAAEDVVVVSPGLYSPEKMHIRNRWIVNNSDALLAIFNGLKGGTYSTVQYARKRAETDPNYLIHIIDT